jgi:hypothetical protein
MEQFLSVREARRTFAWVLNTAAYGERRTIVVRRGEVVGAVVSPDDLQFLLRYRPSEESELSQQALERDRRCLEGREHVLRAREERAQGPDTPEAEKADVAAERRQLTMDRKLLEAMIALQTPAEAARSVAGTARFSGGPAPPAGGARA